MQPAVSAGDFDALKNAPPDPSRGTGSTGVSGSTLAGNDSVIAPLADRLSNSGNAGINYQYSANAMIGASATFTNLHYPDPTEVPGLYDAASRLSDEQYRAARGAFFNSRAS